MVSSGKCFFLSGNEEAGDRMNLVIYDALREPKIFVGGE